ncbi:MAG: VOC family protein [Magnetococcales bacterium]|nr:VOC family protein [Magnetococcales bacterium]
MSDQRLVCDHIGLATHALELTTAFFTGCTAFTVAGPAVVDPHQGVTIRFLGNPDVPWPRIELLQPLSPRSPVFRQARGGGGPLHLCFQVASLADFRTVCRSARLTPLSQPAPAPAFGEGRRVAFVQVPGVGVIELVETPGAAALERLADLPIREMKQSFVALNRLPLPGPGVPD